MSRAENVLAQIEEILRRVDDRDAPMAVDEVLRKIDSFHSGEGMDPRPNRREDVISTHGFQSARLASTRVTAAGRDDSDRYVGWTRHILATKTVPMLLDVINQSFGFAPGDDPKFEELEDAS